MRVWVAIAVGCGMLLGSLTGAAAKNSSVVYQQKVVQGIRVNVVTVNLNDPEVKVTAALARGRLRRSESFKSLINRIQPAAAITGTFFDTRSLLPVGDIVVDGRMIHQGVVGTGVAFTADNEVHFVPLTRGASRDDWSYYQAVLRAGPWLVRNGARNVRPWAEGFTDRSLYARRPRAAIGLTRHNKLLLVTIPRPVHYTQASKVMKALGAVQALGMDGGSSTALSIRGRIISNPSRQLTNVLAVYDKPWNYERALALNRLAPRPKGG